MNVMMQKKQELNITSSLKKLNELNNIYIVFIKYFNIYNLIKTLHIQIKPFLLYYNLSYVQYYKKWVNFKCL